MTQPNMPCPLSHWSQAVGLPPKDAHFDNPYAAYYNMGIPTHWDGEIDALLASFQTSDKLSLGHAEPWSGATTTVKPLPSSSSGNDISSPTTNSADFAQDHSQGTSPDPRVLIPANGRRSAPHRRFHLCTICSGSFTEARSLRRHTQTQHYHTPTLFFCPFANCKSQCQGYKRRDYLLKHLRKKHGQRVS